MAGIMNLPVDGIRVGDYVQRMGGGDEGLDGLAASIGRIGIVSPLVVSRDGDDYVLVAGHRRLAAAIRCNHRTVPCVEAGDRRELAAEINLAENVFRKDLSPVELAAAVKDVLEKGSMGVEQVAAGLHRSVEWVRRMVGMLDWPADVLEAIHNEAISVSAAHNLALVEDAAYREFLVRNAVESGATARATAAWLQAWRALQPKEEAVQAKPPAGGRRAEPMVPQAPCLACGDVYRTDELSHVPVCGRCIRLIRNAAG